jgi:MFS family permease
VLPVFCFGTYGAIFSVYITGTLHVPYGTWGLLLALNALVIAVLQYPLVRVLRRTDRLGLLALASVLVGLGLGLSAFVRGVWPLVGLVVLLSFGEMLLSPFASAVVSDLAPEAVRGRYMGVWTVVWNGGASLGPAVAGVTMDAIGGRRTFMIILAVGLLGGALFLALRKAIRRSGGGAAYRGGVATD